MLVMRERWYDIAQVCRNGHLVNALASSYPESNTAFCPLCGASTIDACPSCGTPIRGVYHLSGMASDPYVIPSYCVQCGVPYPWTAIRLAAAQILVDEAASLSPEERRMLKESICDVVRQTPRAPAAVVRFKRLAAKAGAGLAESLREILVDIVSEAMKKVLWG